MIRHQIKDYLQESQLFLSRAVVAGFFVFIVLMILIIQLANLQIKNQDHYTTLSRDNRVKLAPLPPVRGLIYDRNGEILAQNRATYSLEITPEQVDDLDKTLTELGQLIHINKDQISRFTRLKKQRRRFESIPLKVSLSPDEVAIIAVNRHRFPGVDIQAKLLRDYPYAEKTAHVLGYVGRINKKELERIDNSMYAGTTHIGKNGVEKAYEAVLHGEVGMQQLETNVLGRTVRILSKQEPKTGKNLILNLDIKLQEIALNAFGDENGSVVAINPKTGGVLVMASNPGFDPNLFVEGISTRAYRALQASPNKPLFNRALRGQYPPGSTLKPFIALAGLETQTIAYKDKKFCGGFFQLPNHSHKYRDWKKTGHGNVSMDEAITQSCDVYFYELSHDMGIDKIQTYLSKFGFGQKSGIDLGAELPGLLPSREWKKRRHNKPWYPGETLIMGIGQGYFLTTPLQLASATATLANGGIYHSPRIVNRIIDQHNDASTERIDTTQRKIPVHQQNLLHIKEAMNHVIENIRGTAKRIKNPFYRIAGKTGTAQVFTVKQDEKYEEDKVSKKNRDHALFIAYAPIEDPKIAIAVIVENGGHGGSKAAPIAKKIMDAYLLNSSETQH